MTSTNAAEQATEDAINAGAFKDCYLIYNRKSTDEIDSQKNSIDYQRSENGRFAKRSGRKIAPITLTGFCTDGVISEKHSAFKQGAALEITDNGQVQYCIERPKFLQLARYLSQGYFKGVICLCWDRISRNEGDDTVIKKLRRAGVDFSFAYTTYEDSSSGELHMDIDGMFSQHYSRVTSEKIKTTIKEKRAQGKCTYRAPIGYLNPGSMDHKPFDPERAPIITELFELYTTGDWSLSDLARHARKQGLRSVPVRRKRSKEEMLNDEDDLEERKKVSHPLTVNRISAILKNPFYTGKVIGPDGNYVPSTSHKPLVSQQTFDQVQMLLQRKKVSKHYTEKLDHPFRGFVRCAVCRRVYTPYSKKGHLYYNARCAPECKNTLKNCNFTFIAGQIGTILSGLSFTPEEITEIDARASAEIALLENRAAKVAAQAQRAKKRITEELDYLATNQLSLLKSGLYTPEGITEERAKLEKERDDLHEKEQVSAASMQQMLKEVAKCSELLKSASSLYQMAEPHEKERIAKLVVSELLISENTVDYSLQIAFEPLADRIRAFSAPKEWLSELLGRQLAVCSQSEQLAAFLLSSGDIR